MAKQLGLDKSQNRTVLSSEAVTTWSEVGDKSREQILKDSREGLVLIATAEKEKMKQSVWLQGERDKFSLKA